jgi:hypothetical protein
MSDLLTQIKDKWFVVVFIASMILWYANTNARLNAVEAKQAEQISIVADITQLKIDMAVVKENVLIIKDAIK